jgi:hypothetical protein
MPELPDKAYSAQTCPLASPVVTYAYHAGRDLRIPRRSQTGRVARPISRFLFPFRDNGCPIVWRVARPISRFSFPYETRGAPLFAEQRVG